MRTKTYFGKSLQDAMNRAKADLGVDVSILESREINGNGNIFNGDSLIQITVMADEKINLKEESRINGNPVTVGDSKKMPFTNYLSSLAPKPKESDEHKMDISNELLILRHEMSKLNNRLRKMTSPDFPKLFSQIFEQLLATGISEEHASSFVRRAYLRLDGKSNITKNDILDAVKPEVISLFEENKNLNNSDNEKPKIVMIIGPTGVGKTTAIMKLAVHPDIFGAKNVAIISTDTYRMAATESLSAFSKIASIPVIEAKSPEDVKSRIDKLNGKDIILIDTAGRSPYFPNYIQELKQYITTIEPSDILMVLSLTTDLEDLYLSSGLYLMLNPTGIILSKMDETGRPGKIVSMSKEVNLPIRYISNGQSIPNDISIGDGEYVWNKIVKSGL